MSEIIHDPGSGYKVPVLLEDGPLLVVNKPAGLISQGAPAGQPSAVDLVKDFVKRKYNKPGNVWLGVCHRLDRPVSGVVVFARNSKAAARLSEQFRERTVTKTYLAIVENGPTDNAGELEDWLLQRDDDQRVRLVKPGTADAKRATLKYAVLKRRDRKCLLRIELGTGRKHQIRVQLAEHGWPIAGDTKYGATAWNAQQRRLAREQPIALHAARLTLRHPIRREEVSITAALPDTWIQQGFSINTDWLNES